MSTNQWILEDQSLTEKDLLKNEALFHSANGYIGLRGNFEEGYAPGYKTIRGTYINGVYDIGELKYSEKFIGYPEEYQKIVNLVDVQGMEIFIDDERFTLFDGEVISYKRTLDMEKGIVHRKIKWRSNKGHELEIIIKRMVSFVILEMVTFEFIIKSLNFKGKLEFISTQNGNVKNYADSSDPRLAHEAPISVIIDECKVEEELGVIHTHIKHSKIFLSTLVAHKCSKEASYDFVLDDKMIKTKINTHIDSNEVISLQKYAIFTDSRRYENYKEKAAEIMNKVRFIDLELWYKQQEMYLSKFWKNSEIEIDSTDNISLGLKYNVYCLLQSVGKDKFSNIAAKGLSGEGYEGHYFWDTEIYMFPFFLLTDRTIAKSLLSFRYNILDRAREQARLLGHQKGALYPWRTITGTECSSYFPSGSAQYHINGDVAYTFIQYYLMTKDIEVIKDMGAEVLFEIARLWIDVGHFEGNDFKIDGVTGPDEYTCIVNNNYYTNCVAKYSLEWAVKFYYKLENTLELKQLCQRLNLDELEVQLWEKAAKQMYLPIDTKKNINPQDDTFLSKKMWDFEAVNESQYPLLLHFHPLYLYRHQVLKQADTVLAHFLLEDYQSLEVIRNSFKYYEKITTHDSSLSTCIYSIMASRLGMSEKAYNYFCETATLDIDDTHDNTMHGIHTANMGGSYMAVVYGFAGLRIKESGISFQPSLPSKWNGYRFNITYLESLFKVEVSRHQIQFTLLSGDAVEITIFDKKYELGQEGLTLPF